MGYSGATLPPDTVQLLLGYDWPGNIRELENAIHRALLVSPTSQLRPQDFRLTGLRPQPSPSTLPVAGSPTLDAALKTLFDNARPRLYEHIEATVIRAAYEYCRHNQVQTARLLDISRNILRHRMAQYEITQASSRKPAQR